MASLEVGIYPQNSVISAENQTDCLEPASRNPGVCHTIGGGGGSATQARIFVREMMIEKRSGENRHSCFQMRSHLGQIHNKRYRVGFIQIDIYQILLPVSHVTSLSRTQPPRTKYILNIETPLELSHHHHSLNAATVTFISYS
jgi:hypothetical protein